MGESSLLFLVYCLIQLAGGALDRILLSLRKTWHEVFHEDVKTHQHKNYRIAEAERVRMHCWLLVTLVPTSPSAQTLFCRAFLSGWPPSCFGTRGCSSPDRGFLFLFIKCHDISFGTFLQPLELPLNGSTNQITGTQLPSRPVPQGTLTSRMRVSYESFL